MRPREEARREARALSGGAASSRSDTLCFVRRLLLLALLLARPNGLVVKKGTR